MGGKWLSSVRRKIGGGGLNIDSGRGFRRGRVIWKGVPRYVSILVFFLGFRISDSTILLLLQGGIEDLSFCDCKSGYGKFGK